MKKFKGLTSAEVQASKNAHGDNRLSSKEANSLLSIFIEAFQDQWILILLAALGLKIIFNFVGMIFPAIGEANWYEAISLIFAILMSTGFSAVSQYRNEQKFNTLQEEASKTNAKVYRDGKLKEVLVDDIVKGDQILLQSGDKIPVDGIILEGELKVNQAVLNGESEDAKKLPLGDQAEPDSSDLFTELKVFRGTVVTSGEAVMEATQIGDNTVLGSINTSLQEDSKDSPSKEKLNKLAGNIGVLGYSAGAAYSVINLVLGFIALNKANNLNGGSIFLLIIETILFAVTIIIMAVPEGLPMMLALVSSMNSGRLLAQNILVRHPDTIETAGYMNILFSDKTGTITEGKLSVVDFFLADGTLYAATGETDAPDFDTMSDSLKAEMINGIGLNNDAMVADGSAVGSNATDRALLDFLIGRSQLDFDTNTITEKQQFNSATKFASVTTKDGKTYIKGAPEFILDDCYYYLDKDGYMKTGKIANVEEEDDNYTYYFETKNGKNGQGYTGEKSGYLYWNGKRLEADDDYRIYVVGEKYYLVNNKGKLQKSTSKEYDVENFGDDVKFTFRNTYEIASSTKDGSEGTYKNAATLPKIELFDNAIYQDALGVTHYENTDAYEAAQNAVANK